jgi:RimJ/RimL family protein N-acetyltransferase
MTPIEVITREQLAEHLLALDTAGRHMRFGFSCSDDSIREYALNISSGDFILGIKESITNNTIVAAVHLVISMDAKTAELGISTLLQCRRKGYGERLLRYTVDMLRNRNINQLYSVCIPDNYPLLKLLQKLNITSITSVPGEKEARINIPMAGMDSLINELRNDRLVIIDSAMRPWAELWEHMFHVKLPPSN